MDGLGPILISDLRGADSSVVIHERRDLVMAAEANEYVCGYTPETTLTRTYSLSQLTELSDESAMCRH